MSTNRFANTYQTVNLFRNGGFDFARDDGKVPEFWSLANVKESSGPDSVDSNTYKLVVGDSATIEEPVKDYLRVDLVKPSAATISQSFVSDGLINRLDFQIPQIPKVRSSIPEGYTSTENLLLPANTPFTISFDARVIRGAAKISLKLYDLNLNEIDTGNNLLPSPNNFSPWTGDATVRTDQDQGPFNDNEADILEDTSDTDLQFRYRDTPATSLLPGVYAFGMYMKRGTNLGIGGGGTIQSRIVLNEGNPLRGAFGKLDWATKTLKLSTSDPSDSFVEGSVTPAGNGYFLVEIRKKLTGTFFIRTEIQPASDMSGLGQGNIGVYGAYLRNITDEVDVFNPISIKRDGKWRRYSETFATPLGVGKVELVISKESGDDLTEVHVGKVSLAEGRYSQLPYTGDLFNRCLPQGSIVLMMGDSCPPGFEELGEGGQAPLSEWVSEDPAISARKGNYPRNSISGELEGTVVHNSEDVSITPGKTDVSEFEGYDSKIASFFDGESENENLVDSTRPNPDMDLADAADGIPTHKHILETAEHRPVSRGFRFCKRL
jgi:hypothetical protein